MTGATKVSLDTIEILNLDSDPASMAWEVLSGVRLPLSYRIKIGRVFSSGPENEIVVMGYKVQYFKVR